MSENPKPEKLPGRGSRRKAFSMLAKGAVTAVACTAPAAQALETAEKKELRKLKWNTFFQKYYREMTEEERAETIQRFERKAKLEQDLDVNIDATGPRPNTLFGYAFNVARCDGSRKCVEACVKENNQDRASNIQYIRMFEMDNETGRLEEADSEYSHATPVDGKFYLGSQCHQCENSPCTKACPTGATWKEKDGVIVVDYDWCIGCRYCQVACPYFARRFNWQEPTVPKQEVNTEQHYLTNRMRTKGVMEKCHFCLQRTRHGKNPACVEACPNGARVFGNLLDPNSEIRWVLENKRVFRLKEELGTDPKFWYFSD